MLTVKVEEFQKKPLRVHNFLAGIPLRTLSRVELPGGRAGMTLPEINAIVLSDPGDFQVGPLTKVLFWLRTAIGHIFGWDDAQELVESVSYLASLSEEDRTRSLITPGENQGITRVLYCYENEYLGEIINRTVHCFWLMTSEPTERGYTLYMAVYVKKLNWFTPIYMALVSPMLKWIIYPAIDKGIRQRWAEKFPLGVKGQITTDNAGASGNAANLKRA